MKNLERKPYFFKISTITFRKYGISISGSLFSWGEKNKIVPLKVEEINSLRGLVQGDILITAELVSYSTDKKYAFLLKGRFSSMNSRKGLFLVFYAPYKFNEVDTINFFITQAISKHIKAFSKNSLSFLFYIKNVKKITTKKGNPKNNASCTLRKKGNY